jgi:hypothetical protein
MSNTGDVITGESYTWNAGVQLVMGDFNADGRTDLAVGGTGYATDTGRVYIFYNDGSVPTTVATADVIITGETTGNNFGYALTAGDWNADGRTDLAVGAYGYTTNTGRVYIFHNDGSIPTTAATADVIITGETTSVFFAVSLTSGDYNADSRTDLAVGANGYSTSTGRVYIFYNDGSIPTTAGTADVIITGNATNDRFGTSLTTGDFNADGRTDLAVGAYAYSSSTGRAYVFYNDGSIPTTAGTADVTITGGAMSDQFSASLTAGDFNADGRTDLAVSAQVYSSSTGRVYLFYNDGSIPTTAGTADVTITGGTTGNFFGYALTAGDFNGDGRTDLATGADGYSSNTGRAYIFYNDGSIPTTAATADVIITGNQVNSYFGIASVAGDLNADGRTDLIVYANGITGSVLARTYIFYSQNGQVNTNQSIVGNATNDQFGQSLVTGDFNADGRTDLAVGAKDYSTSTGRVYLFYGDGQIPSTAGTADVTITGEATTNYFGYNSLAAGDFNADGKTDLAVGAYGYSTNTGRAYIFYNDGSIPTTAGTADVIITGETTSNLFGIRLLAGDFNTDGETDLVVGASAYSGDSGRAYIFYNDGSIPTTAGTADVIISGEGASYFGAYMTAGDFNADSRVDLVIGAYGYSSYGNTGRAYIFYNDGSIPTTVGTADVTITGEATSNSFGTGFTAGDFNADGRVDLAVGAYGYSSLTGRVYIFYNDGSIPTTAGTADVIITGETTSNYFGFPLIAGDFNADGRTDLAVGAYGYSSNTGRTYIFYNDGSIPTTAGTADVMITGETTNNYFGFALATGDLNADDRTDLIVGAHGNSSSTGKVYLYETRENFAWQIQRQPQSGSGAFRVGTNTTGQELKITGEATGIGFGTTMTSGDLNADGKEDLVVAALSYSRVYVFYSDGTLATGATNADIVINGGATINQFGSALAIGDFNADGRTDLAVGAPGYSSSTGRAYIFYDDGSLPDTVTSADVIITGEANSYFGTSLVSGDFNVDGTTDIIVGATSYSSITGRAYIFYNDIGGMPTTAATADVTITGEATVNYFGGAMVAGDFNADGRTDLAVGANGYSVDIGRAYIFYNDGSIPTTAGTADVIITGNASGDLFSTAFVAGDFNADGRTDLVVGAHGYSTNTGRAYIFYNDGSIPTTAGTADVTITGQSTGNQLGYYGSLGSGDFNSDGRTDLVAGEYCYSSCTGRTLIFYNDGSIPTTAATADVTLLGETASSYFGVRTVSGDFNADGKIDLVVSAYNYSSSRGRVYMYTLGNDPVITGGATNDDFGRSLVAGDFNSDGKSDLVVAAYNYTSGTGRVYLFYNDGSIPTTAGTADVTITGETTGNYFGASLISGDFNTDGRVDLAIGAYGYSSFTGRAYIFYNDGSIPTTAGTADVTITGGTTSNYFGNAISSGDYNADGRTDLAVGADGYSTNTGRAYLFYNDGSIPTTAGTADVTITGETTNNYFGYALTAGDWNADGRTDLAVGAFVYSSSTGRVYIFYNDDVFQTTATTADVTITGETTSNSFGISLTSGDFNVDGKTDLAVGAHSYSTNTGRVYVYASEVAGGDVSMEPVRVRGTLKTRGILKIR